MPAAPIVAVMCNDQTGRAVVRALQGGVGPIIARDDPIGDAVERGEFHAFQPVHPIAASDAVGDDQCASGIAKAVFGDAAREYHRVIAGAANQRVIAKACDQQVVARPAIKAVIARKTGKLIVAIAAKEPIVIAGAAKQSIGAVPTVCDPCEVVQGQHIAMG